MTAVKIIGSAFRNIFADFGQTIRIFALPVLAFAAILGVAIAILLPYPLRNAWLVLLPAGLMLAFCALWPTINFHRHVLLGERFGWLPRIYPREVLGYGLMMIPMGLLVLGSFFVLGFAIRDIGGLVSGPVPSVNPMLAALLAMLILLTGVTVLALRLFSLLPGLAIGQPLQGYARGSRNSLMTITLIALILSVLRIAYGALPLFIMSHVELPTIMSFLRIAQILDPVISILVSVFGISLLTALYARYVRRAEGGLADR